MFFKKKRSTPEIKKPLTKIEKIREQITTLEKEIIKIKKSNRFTESEKENYASLLKRKISQLNKKL